MVMLRLTLTVATLASLLTGCGGLTGNFRDDPGYAEFDSVASLDTHRELGISLGPVPLGLASWIMNDEPEISRLLDDLRAIRVYTYEVTHDREDVAEGLEDIQSGLVADGWQAIVTVREADENVAVLLRPAERGDGNRGLAVIVQDASEVVLVNLIGNVRLDRFADYMVDLDVDMRHIEIDPETLRRRVAPF
jgi:hypothetical protein